AAVRRDSAVPSSGAAFAASSANGGIICRYCSRSEKRSSRINDPAGREVPHTWSNFAGDCGESEARVLLQPGGAAPPKRGSPASLAERAGTLGKHSSFLHYRLGSHHLHQWVFA